MSQSALQRRMTGLVGPFDGCCSDETVGREISADSGLGILSLGRRGAGVIARSFRVWLAASSSLDASIIR